MNSLTRRANAYAVLMLLCAVLAVPSLAWATSGGGAVSLGAGSGNGSGGPAIVPGDQTITASGGGLTLTTLSTAMLNRGLAISGTTSPSQAGQLVEIERLGHETNWQWTPTAMTTVASDGSFSAVWNTNHIGRFEIRALLGPATAASAAATAAATTSAAPTLTTTIYRPSTATLYGPGLYGKHTACGQRLRRDTIGIANRSLPCGTQVALYYGGRTTIVSVIDRGPYGSKADWDLTMATGRALGIAGTARIGAVSLPPQPAALAKVPAAG